MAGGAGDVVYVVYRDGKRNVVEEVAVLRRSANQIKVVRHRGFGFAALIQMVEAHATREAAIAAWGLRMRALIEHARGQLESLERELAIGVATTPAKDPR